MARRRQDWFLSVIHLTACSHLRILRVKYSLFIKPTPPLWAAMWFKDVKLTGPTEHCCEEKILLVFAFAPRGNGAFKMNIYILYMYFLNPLHLSWFQYSDLKINTSVIHLLCKVYDPMTFRVLWHTALLWSKCVTTPLVFDEIAEKCFCESSVVLILYLNIFFWRCAFKTCVLLWLIIRVCHHILGK